MRNPRNTSILQVLTRASLMLRGWRVGSRLTRNAVAISRLSAELWGTPWWKEAFGLDAPCTVAPRIDWDLSIPTRDKRLD